MGGRGVGCRVEGVRGLARIGGALGVGRVMILGDEWVGGKVNGLVMTL